MLKNCFREDIKVLEAGVDEAGRGPMAGSVFAAAVILPEGFSHPLLNDSKKMSARNRELLAPIIEERALAWCVAEVSAERIDEVNILNATFEAMNLAIEGLGVTPELLLIDGNRFSTSSVIPYECVVKGDATYASIAAASVLAKTHRDRYMLRLHQEYPQYGWDRNAGYGTKAHMEAIERYGLTPYHRLTFKRKK